MHRPGVTIVDFEQGKQNCAFLVYAFTWTNSSKTVSTRQKKKKKKKRKRELISAEKKWRTYKGSKQGKQNSAFLVYAFTWTKSSKIASTRQKTEEFIDASFGQICTKFQVNPDENVYSQTREPLSSQTLINSH